MKIRSGIGYDIHRLEVGGGELRIGGVVVSRDLHFIAHSDGDVLLHALLDAILGAVGAPDIGQLFPDTDPSLAGISSAELVRRGLATLPAGSFRIESVDAVVIAQRPAIAPFRPQIRRSMADLLSIPEEDVNLKGKTKEEMDAVGRGEAIECFCTVMVRILT